MKRRNSLVFYFWLTLNGIVFIALLTISSFHFFREYEHLHDALEHEGLTAANTLNAAIGLYMLQEKYSEISPLTYSVQSEPNIAYIIIKDTNGITVNQKGDTSIQKGILIKRVPIEYFQKEVGTIEIALRTDTFDQQIKHLLRDTLLIIVLFSFISIILSYYVSKKLSFSIKELIEATKQFASGKRDIKVIIKSKVNEINQLAKSFNQMSDTINNHEKILVSEIHKATHDLSEKITTLEVLRTISDSVLESEMQSQDVIKIALQSIQSYIEPDHISYAFHTDQKTWCIFHMHNGQLLPFMQTQLEQIATDFHAIHGEFRNLTQEHQQPFEQTLIKQGMKSLLLLPVTVNHQTIGILNIASSTENAFSPNTMEQLLPFTKQLALALDRISAYESLHHSANHDFLTNLLNYRAFKKDITQMLKQHPDQLAAVIFIDLDRFKMVNDTFGHATGDLLLKHVGQILLNATSPHDLVSRFGGDEFAIFLTQLTDFNKAIDVAQTILHNLEQPLITKGYEINISASIGIAYYPDNGADTDTLLKNSDRAMYRIKNAERNNFAIYASSDTRIDNGLILENDIRKGLERNEFIVYYQPKVNVQTGKISGAEALIRWIHPHKGFISPGEFIPLAEETELIIAIGEFVLREAARQCVYWQKEKGVAIPIAVNLSVRQFYQQSLVQNISTILHEMNMDPTLLELEITESMSMDIEQSLEILQNLKQLGVQVSVDDFGTGYSSLNYLHRLPIDRVKIDKSFINDIVIDNNNNAIVNSIIHMSHNLKLQVVAEGVETKEQMDYLRLHHCDEIQGYYFSKPLPANEFEEKFIHHYKNITLS